MQIPQSPRAVKVLKKMHQYFPSEILTGPYYCLYGKLGDLSDEARGISGNMNIDIAQSRSSF